MTDPDKQTHTRIYADHLRKLKVVARHFKRTPPLMLGYWIDDAYSKLPDDEKQPNPKEK